MDCSTRLHSVDGLLIALNFKRAGYQQVTGTLIFLVVLIIYKSLNQLVWVAFFPKL